MPLVATRGGASAFGLGWSAGAGEEELGGMVLLKPTSIAYTGTSATINSSGSITLTNVTEFALNGIFSGDYMNYMIQMNVGHSGGGDTYRFKFRSSGTNTSATTYYSQQLNGQTGQGIYGYEGTFVQASPGNIGPVSSGNQIFIYNPFGSTSTPARSVGASSNGPEITDLGFIWGGSDSFDGVWFLSASSKNLNGTVCVYGLVGA